MSILRFGVIFVLLALMIVLGAAIVSRAVVQPGDEARHGLEHGRGLVAMRCMAAAVEAEQLDRAADLLRDGVDLRHGAVLVVEALDREHRAGDARQVLLDVPRAEFRVQPDVVPAAERRLGVGVMARQALAQVGGLERGLRAGNARHAQVLDEDMRGHDHEASHAVPGAGVDQRDRAAVAVPDQDRLAHLERVEHARQRLERLVVHVAHRARRAQDVGVAVAQARVDDHRAARRLRGLARKVAPHRDGAETFVQEHQRGRVAARAGESLDFQLVASDGDGGEDGRLGQAGLGFLRSGRGRPDFTAA
jgi:hypothetical protein